MSPLAKALEAFRQRRCKHEWKRTGGYGGSVAFYECPKCDAEDEKDYGPMG